MQPVHARGRDEGGTGGGGVPWARITRETQATQGSVRGWAACAGEVRAGLRAAMWAALRCAEGWTGAGGVGGGGQRGAPARRHAGEIGRRCPHVSPASWGAGTQHMPAPAPAPPAPSPPPHPTPPRAPLPSRTHWPRLPLCCTAGPTPCCITIATHPFTHMHARTKAHTALLLLLLLLRPSLWHHHLPRAAACQRPSTSPYVSSTRQRQLRCKTAAQQGQARGQWWSWWLAPGTIGGSRRTSAWCVCTGCRTCGCMRRASLGGAPPGACCRRGLRPWANEEASGVRVCWQQRVFAGLYMHMHIYAM